MLVAQTGVVKDILEERKEQKECFEYVDPRKHAKPVRFDKDRIRFKSVGHAEKQQLDGRQAFTSH